MIEVCSITAGYGKPRTGNAVLKALSCTIPAQQITVLIGANGSGKTTLLKTLCGFLPVWSGSIQLLKKPLSAYSLRERAQYIAYVGQKHELSASRPDLTVRDLVLQGRFPYTGFPRHYTARDRERADEALRALNLTDLAEKAISTLSGGQQQKAYLALALCQQTPLLVLDEPLTFLDIRQQLELLSTLQSLKADGKTICLVVHDLNTALTFADKLIVLCGGTVVAEGAPTSIASSGIIDTVFGVRTEHIPLPDGKKLYTFVKTEHNDDDDRRI